jgi:class 3 adenylate cyclase
MNPENSAEQNDATTPRLLGIMFTDIVNSSALKEKIGPEEYRWMKQRHDGFLKQALFQAPTARILQDTGDGHFIVFDSIAQAVSSALIFQALMVREPWTHQFKTRVGLHLGEVREGRNSITGRADYTSSAIDIANRTMSLALGGQILVTRAVYDAARHLIPKHPVLDENEAPPKVRWMPHGEYRFKGASETTEVFEVGAEGIAPLRPPVKSEKARRYISLLGMRAGSSRRSQWTALIFVAVVGLAVIGFGIRAHLHSVEGDAATALERAEMERYVRRLKATPVTLVKYHPPGTKEVDVAHLSDNADFEVLRDERVYDLREWRPIPPDKVSELFSPITSTRRFFLKRIGPSSNFDWQARTSGLNLFAACPGPYPYQVEVQRGDTITGNERMKVRKVSVDVSSVPMGAEFQITSEVTMWNSLETEDEQWLGLIGYKKSFLASMLILFPEKKPLKKYWLTVSQTTKSEQIAYTGPRVVIVGKKSDWIYWKVPNPESGYVYRLYWKW